MEIGLDDPAKFGDSGSNRSCGIRSAHFVMDDYHGDTEVPSGASLKRKTLHVCIFMMDF